MGMSWQNLGKILPWNIGLSWYIYDEGSPSATAGSQPSTNAARGISECRSVSGLVRLQIDWAGCTSARNG